MQFFYKFFVKKRVPVLNLVQKVTLNNLKYFFANRFKNRLNFDFKRFLVNL
jgi:hypothetical protein